MFVTKQIEHRHDHRQIMTFESILSRFSLPSYISVYYWLSSHYLSFHLRLLLPSPYPVISLA